MAGQGIDVHFLFIFFFEEHIFFIVPFSFAGI